MSKTSKTEMKSYKFKGQSSQYSCDRQKAKLQGYDEVLRKPVHPVNSESMHTIRQSDTLPVSGIPESGSEKDIRNGIVKGDNSF